MDRARHRETPTITPMPHSIQRPPSRVGVGPLPVFRAVSNRDARTTQTPAGWVRRQPAFLNFTAFRSAGRSLEEAAAFSVANGIPNVPKCLTEVVYEDVRLEIALSAPSRLDSVFGFVDIYEAFSFLSASNEAQCVFAGEVPDGAPWVVTPMDVFQVQALATAEAADVSQAIAVASADAARYWDASTPLGDHAEVLTPLIEIRQPQLRLLGTLRAHGLLV